MSMSTMGRSPLRAARRWRDVSLVVAARTSGIPLTQAEALEAGDASAFDSPEEMIATAVLYGASLGIGRDEALALLDRTVGTMPANPAEQRSDSDGAEPDEPVKPLQQFSQAVAARTAPDAETTGEIPVTEVELAPLDAMDTSAFTPPEAAGDVAQAMAVDASFAEAYARSSGELEQWAAEYGNEEPAGHVFDKVLAQADRFFVKVLGQRTGARAASSVRRISDDAREGSAALKVRLKRSEHGSLILAVCGGVVLLAFLVAIASALGPSNSSSSQTPAAASSTAKTAHVGTAPHGAVAAASAAKAASTAGIRRAKNAQLPPSAITVDVENAGSKKGAAGTMAARVERLGYSIGAVGNAKLHTYTASTIFAAPAMQPEAIRLSRAIGIHRIDRLPAGSGRLMRVVVM